MSVTDDTSPLSTKEPVFGRPVRSPLAIELRHAAHRHLTVLEQALPFAEAQVRRESQQGHEQERQHDGDCHQDGCAEGRQAVTRQQAVGNQAGQKQSMRHNDGAEAEQALAEKGETPGNRGGLEGGAGADASPAKADRTKGR